MHMLNERLQVLVTVEQRRRLESEARRRGISVGGLIREAVDAHLGAVTRADRVQAVDDIRVLRGRFLAPAELDRLVDEERETQADTEGSARAR